MKDVVELLREYVAADQQPALALLDRAADEIERLRAEIARIVNANPGAE